MLVAVDPSDVLAAPGAWSTLLYLIGWTAGWVLLWRARPLPPAARRPASVGVVVPARDEEMSLPTLLASLADELGPDDQLVVVDDHSTDATAALAASAGATVMAAPELPAGWAGKPHACHVGATCTAADVVVFLDADVRLVPGTIDALVAEVERHPDEIVSVQPHHRTVAAHEQASLLFNLVALMGCGAFTPAGDRVATHVAFGPVLACTRATYDRIGGHAHPDVRGAVLEDIALARRCARTRLFAGTSRGASFRMYPRDLAQVVEGWTKGVGIGVDATPWWALIGTAAWVTSLAGGAVTSIWFVLASLVQLAVLARRAGSFRWWAVALYPAWCVLLLVVVGRSVWRRRRGGEVRWKGRSLRPDQSVGRDQGAVGSEASAGGSGAGAGDSVAGAGDDGAADGRNTRSR